MVCSPALQISTSAVKDGTSAGMAAVGISGEASYVTVTPGTREAATVNDAKVKLDFHITSSDGA